MNRIRLALAAIVLALAGSASPAESAQTGVAGQNASSQEVEQPPNDMGIMPTPAAGG